MADPMKELSSLVNFLARKSENAECKTTKSMISETTWITCAVLWRSLVGNSILGVCCTNPSRFGRESWLDLP